MKELEFLEIIKKTLSKKGHIGDDCAYLKDLELVVTQDSLIEGIHFSRKFSSSYQLGYKAIAVNLSDIFASGAAPAYATISISLPKNIDSSFVKNFYKACDELSKKYDFEIIGGDLTGSDKIFISVCMIGTTKGRKISSRRYAKVGDLVVTTGNHGSSAAGLWILQNHSTHQEILSKLFQTSTFINKHLNPIPQRKLSQEIAQKVNRDYAMMDTSDGLIDAAYKIATASNLAISIDFDKIPYDKELKSIARMANIDYKDWIFYGGEDYQLVVCMDEKNLKNIDTDYKIIGRVIDKKDDHYVQINFEDSVKRIVDLEKTYNHFKEG